jgi:hypothetical protein
MCNWPHYVIFFRMMMMMMRVTIKKIQYVKKCCHGFRLMEWLPKVNIRQAVYRAKLQTRDSSSKIITIKLWSTDLV